MSDTRNEDWIKRTWDYRMANGTPVTTLDQLLRTVERSSASEAQRRKSIKHMTTLPSWNAAPAKLKKEVESYLI